MDENAVALTFIHNVGLRNLSNDDVLHKVIEYLDKLDNKVDNSLNIASNTTVNVDSSISDYINLKAVGTFDGSDTSISNQTSIEVQLLEYLIKLREDGSKDSSNHVKTRIFLSIIRNILVQLLSESSWNLYLEDDLDLNNLPWNKIPRLFSLLIISLKLEEYLKLNESTIFPLFVNEILYKFRFIFQSYKSNLCIIDRPEWAFEYIRDVIKKYVPIFKRVKNELKSNVLLYFNDLFEGIEIDVLKEDFLLEFSKLCNESGYGYYISKWCLLLIKELKLFVYTRLPLLVYDYYKLPNEELIKLYDLMGIIEKGEIVFIKCTRSYFEDEIKLNILYTLLNSIIDLSFYLRTIDVNLCHELFSDFDSNLMIPCMKFVDYNDKCMISLDYNDKCIYGVMDVLISLDKYYSSRVIKNLLNEEDDYYCNLGNILYLQDNKHLYNVINIILILLKHMNDHCQCLYHIESKSKYSLNVITPIITYYIDDVKQKWNSIDDILKSYISSCYLLESSNILYTFLLQYQQGQFLSNSLNALSTLIDRMIIIIGQYIIDFIYEPLKHINKYHLDVIETLFNLLLEFSIICSSSIYDRIVKQALGSIENILKSVLMPENKRDYIIFNVDDDINMIIQNW